MRGLGDFSTRVLHRLGLLDLARVLFVGNGRFAVMFHGIAGERYENIPPFVQPTLTDEDLRSILAWLHKRFGFLTPEAFLTTDRNGVLLTFDDGQANNYTRALPVLEDFEAPAIFFVSVQHVTAPRNWLPAARATVRSHWQSEEDVDEDLSAELYDGLSTPQLGACGAHPLITIGSHSVSHPFLTRCVGTQLEYEVVSSRNMLRDIAGQAVELFAYPTGDYDRGVAEAVKSAGYKAAFAVDPRNVGLPAFEIPRVGIYSAAPSYLSAKLCGLHRRASGHSILAASNGAGFGQ